jgi:hypothetical protein
MKKLQETMPVEAKLDLLVDAELPEDERRELLLALDQEAAGKGWRALSVRFLERQVEKQAAREWLGAAAAPAPGAENANNHSLPMTRQPAHGYLRSIAAGLLVAAVSAVVTIYAVRRPTAVRDPQVTQAAGPIVTDIPGEVLNYPHAVRMNVPVENVQNLDQPFFPTDSWSRGDLGSKRSVVIQADASGNPVVIPVTPLRMRFY